MVSESDLLTRLREILSSSDLDTATAGSVRRELEKHFGADLSDRKAFIRDQIDIYLESQVANHQDEDDDEGAAAEEEEEVGEGSENAEQNDDVKVEEDDEEEEEPVRKARRKKAPKKVDKGGAKRGGFKTVYSLSPQLQVVVGEPEMARPEVVKKIWAYIREKDLQDPKNRRNIICDETLHAVFHVKSIDMFKMNKVLSKHIWPLNSQDGPVKKTKKEEDSDHSLSEGDVSNVDEQEVEEEEEDVEKEKGSNCKQTKKRRSAKVDKEVKKRGGGFTKLSSLSPELQKFTGASELARTEVVKRLWNYIRENNLQDPNNRRVIICDELFRTLFDVDSIDMFQMNKALSKHILPLNQEALENASQTEKQSEHEQEASIQHPDSDEADHNEKRQKNGD
uniref:upstream activation factor subunit spp27 isoform X2 n=1 Tax=Fragaria vesca subsp. vesca TaxID=101020 RepID=UPI0005C8BB04|nr:PREDICTED: upstream activation factor subunit spp27 isoform X2 [Fragaria vesca subsp. vesca]